MSVYPEAISEHRFVQDLPGVEFNPEDTRTLFADDINVINSDIEAIQTTLGINPQGEAVTVADRLDNAGGGGAVELVGVAVSDGSSELIAVSGLDLATDKIYDVYFSVMCSTPTTRLDLKGANGVIGVNFQGSRTDGSELRVINGVDYLSHPGIGPGVGVLTLQAAPNGTTTAILSFTIGGQRQFTLAGCDYNWSNGGQSLTTIEITGQGWNLLTPGSYLRVYKRSLT